MKRNIDLIRKMMLEIESTDDTFGLSNPRIKGYSPDEIVYCCKLLKDSGFVDGFKVSYADNQIHSYSVGQLTWKGHEYLELIRNPDIWNSIKSFVESGVPFTEENVKRIVSCFCNNSEYD